jgi:hypothetical protein
MMPMVGVMIGFRHVTLVFLPYSAFLTIPEELQKASPALAQGCLLFFKLGCASIQLSLWHHSIKSFCLVALVKIQIEIFIMLPHF